MPNPKFIATSDWPGGLFPAAGSIASANKFAFLPNNRAFSLLLRQFIERGEIDEYTTNWQASGLPEILITDKNAKNLAEESENRRA